MPRVSISTLTIAAAGLLSAALMVAFAVPARSESRTIRVPADESSIQDAIDAARDGDTVLVSPGVYHEVLHLDGKRITLASNYLNSLDEADIRGTVLDGVIPLSTGGSRRAAALLSIGHGAGPSPKEKGDTKKATATNPSLPTRIVGFTIRNADDGISCRAAVEIAHNRFIANTDAIDYESGGGQCHHNVFEKNRDDAVDVDGPTSVQIKHNRMSDSGDDGVEIRLHPYSGPTLDIVIRHNTISASKEDGIQIIDYSDVSDRKITISHNLIEKTKMAAIGCMSKGNSEENYEGADIPEPIFIHHNTFVDNHRGISGGASLTLPDNVIRAGEGSLAKERGH
jgi:hypothetical protein